MKLLCLNVRSGGGSRWSEILDFVEAHRADIVIFTEWRRSEVPGAAATWATSHGMKWVGACEGTTKNGVFIASAALRGDQRHTGQGNGRNTSSRCLLWLDYARGILPATRSEGEVFRGLQ